MSTYASPKNDHRATFSLSHSDAAFCGWLSVSRLASLFQLETYGQQHLINKKALRYLLLELFIMWTRKQPIKLFELITSALRSFKTSQNEPEIIISNSSTSKLRTYHRKKSVLSPFIICWISSCGPSKGPDPQIGNLSHTWKCDRN